MKKAVLVSIAILLAASLAWAGSSVTKTCTAKGDYTTAIQVKQHGTLRISGTYDGIITLQRSEDQGSTWVDTGDTWTAGVGVFPFTDHTNRYYRAGVSVYSSGTAYLELGSGD